MLRSLRFQLPALFLLGVVIAGLVSAAIALRLFQSYAQNRARAQDYTELSNEANGLTKLYKKQAGLKRLSAQYLELATGGDKIYYRGIPIFPGQGRSAFRFLPEGAVDVARVKQGGPVRFVFRPPGARQLDLAVARPLKVGSQTFGVIAVAKPRTVLNQH